MRKGIILVLLAAVGVALAIYFSIKTYSNNKRTKTQLERSSISPTPDIAGTTRTASTSLFIPYWQLHDETGSVHVEGYDRYIFFGITADAQGIVTDDPGYKALSKFLLFAPSGVKTVLTLRLTNTDANDIILKDPQLQKSIASQAARIAADNGFAGVLIDFEYQALFGDTVTPQITSFVSLVSQEAHAKHLQVATALYGDVFYRKRPYDVQKIAALSDEIMIMAYDFHKSRGEAGPNFPLRGNEKYGYDYEQMVADFTQVVPTKKIAVIFGMYGYDWIVDEKKRPIKAGSSMTLAEITQNYINQCQILNCVLFRDKDAAEQEIDFVDQYNQYHVVWFEDKQSASQKKEFLQQKGIGSTVFWAYGYF